MLHGNFRHVAVAASTALVVVLSAATTAHAGCGMNAILGANTCDGTTSLTGSFLGDLFSVKNTNAGGSAIRGESASTAANAIGIFGTLTSTAPGANATAVRGLNAGTNANGSGVFGSHAGAGAGVRGTSVSGSGVVGVHTATTGNSPGVLGDTASTVADAVGVSGRLTSTAPGAGSAAVRGQNLGTNANGNGVLGTHAGSGTGVRGDTVGGIGVFGRHTAATGTSPGVRGDTSSTEGQAAGVLGRVTPTGPGGFSAGVRGINNGTGGLGIGVYGSHAGGGWGVYGDSPSGIGVNGESDSGTGVAARGDGSAPALTATNTDAGPAAAFSNVSGAPFTVDSSTRVDNLNADQLDGLHANEVGGRTAVAAVISYNNSSGQPWVQQASIIIDAPRDGLMLVNGAVSIDSFVGGDTSCDPCTGVMRLRDKGTDTLSAEQVGTFGDGTNEAGTQLGTTWVFPVAAGRQTFALETLVEDATDPGNVFSDNPTLTALFVPFGPSGFAAASTAASPGAVTTRRVASRRR